MYEQPHHHSGPSQHVPASLSAYLNVGIIDLYSRANDSFYLLELYPSLQAEHPTTGVAAPPVSTGPLCNSKWQRVFLFTKTKMLGRWLDQLLKQLNSTSISIIRCAATGKKCRWSIVRPKLMKRVEYAYDVGRPVPPGEKLARSRLF